MHRRQSGGRSTSTLAELLGYAVAQQEWPGWIDDLAEEIEEAFGGVVPHAGAAEGHFSVR